MDATVRQWMSIPLHINQDSPPATKQSAYKAASYGAWRVEKDARTSSWWLLTLNFFKIRNHEIKMGHEIFFWKWFIQYTVLPAQDTGAVVKIIIFTHSTDFQWVLGQGTGKATTKASVISDPYLYEFYRLGRSTQEKQADFHLQILFGVESISS